jgi:hypothetical protein
VVKGEFANIGVLLREAGRDDTARIRFTRDWTRVRCLDADADVSLLEALESEIDARLKTAATDAKPILSIIEDSFSNSIQMTEAKACLAESVVAEMDHLMRMYVEPIRVKQPRRISGRAAIAATMRTEFERAGAWGLMRKRIAASLYTQPGDPMKIDCGYRPNGVIRMFHAVSLEADVEAAKVLAWSAPRLREGVQRVESATLDLTAIVEPLRTIAGDETDSESAERYRFGVDTMESQQIRVLTTADLARAAETARVELRV